MKMVKEIQTSIQESKNDVICIIGMHRSGTSMVARLLNQCGLDLGPSEQLLPPNEANPLGYFENENFTYKINDALLDHFGGTWDNPPHFKGGWEHDPSLELIIHEAKSLLKTFSNSSKWGWKDPRASILLPFWKSLITDLRFVICVRSPLEVAKSLAKRNKISIQKGVYLWYQYMRAAIRDTEGCSRIFIFYEDFFDDSISKIDKEISRLAEFCGLELPVDLSSLHDTISRELKHHTSETNELLKEDKITTDSKLFYIGLRALKTDGFVRLNEDRKREDLISENISRFCKLLERFHDENKMAKLESKVSDMENQIYNFSITNKIQQQSISDKEQLISNILEDRSRILEDRSRLYHYAAYFQADAEQLNNELNGFYENRLLRAYWKVRDKFYLLVKKIDILKWKNKLHPNYYNEVHFCNLCGWKGDNFIGIEHPDSLQCPECLSSARDRMFYETFLSHLRKLSLVNKTFLLDDIHIPHQIIEINPEFKNLKRRNSYRNRMIAICDQYIEIDYSKNVPKACYFEDLLNLSFSDDSLDFVLFPNNFQNIQDDKRMFREVFRVLKGGGVAFLQIPILQFKTSISPHKGIRYGWDIVDKIRDAGFEVSILVCDEFMICFESFPSNDFILFDKISFNSKYGNSKEAIGKYPFKGIIQKGRQMNLSIYPFGAYEIFKCYKKTVKQK